MGPASCFFTQLPGAPGVVPPEGGVPPEEGVPPQEGVPVDPELVVELVLEPPPSASLFVPLVMVHALITATPSAAAARRVTTVNLALEFISVLLWGNRP